MPKMMISGRNEVSGFGAEAAGAASAHAELMKKSIATPTG
jgi:hypothetical protein